MATVTDSYNDTRWAFGKESERHVKAEHLKCSCHAGHLDACFPSDIGAELSGENGLLKSHRQNSCKVRSR